MQIIDRRRRVIAFHAAKECPVNRWILAMSAQVGQEDCIVRRLVKLGCQIQEPRTVGAISMQQNDRRRAFAGANQPAARFGPVMIGPGDVRCDEGGPGHCGKGFRRDQIRRARRARDAINDPDRHRKKRDHDHQSDRQECSGDSSYD